MLPFSFAHCAEIQFREMADFMGILGNFHEKRIYKIFVLLLGLAGICPAQEKSPFTPDLMRTLQQLQRAASASEVGYDFLEHLSDEIGPRLPGSPQAAAAVDYLTSQFQRLGLQVSNEPVVVPHWVRGDERAELVQFPGMRPGLSQKIIVTALGGSVPTPRQGITAQLLIVEKLSDLEGLAPEAVKGKIVLFNQAFDRELANAGFAHQAYVQVVRQRVSGANKVAAMGAVGSLLRSIGSADFRLAHTGAVVYSGDRKIPAGAVSSEDADLIERLSRRGPVLMHLLLTPEILPDVTSANVIADLQGDQFPQQIVIISAHLDSWDLGTGALDNGAGVAAVLQAAQVITSLHLKPLRTIRFVAWMNEEEGGSGYYQYLDHHKGELKDHVAVLDIDVGTCHPVGYTADASPNAMEMLQPLSSVLQAQRAAVAEKSNEISDFTEYGIVTFDPLVDNRNYYDTHHTVADTFDKVDPKGLQENAALIAVLAYAVSSIEPRVRLK